MDAYADFFSGQAVLSILGHFLGIGFLIALTVFVTWVAVQTPVSISG